MDKKVKTGIIVLVVILIIATTLYLFFTDREDSESDDRDQEGDITVIQHEDIYEFDANINRNAEEYPGEVKIENLEVIYTMHEEGAPVIYSTYTSEEGERHWYIEYEGDNAEDIQEGDSISVIGEFHDAFRVYEDFDPGDDETKSDTWTISFVADEVKILSD